MRPLRIGTRGSALALLQAEEVVRALQERFPEREFPLVVIRTRGDRFRRSPLDRLGRGVFTKELEEALLRGDIDLAVHSLKDLPSALPPGLTLASVPPRLDPRDVLVSREGKGLQVLPPGARVGTSSPRRAALLRALRPDLQVLPVRGNVDTRVRKVHLGGYDAVVVAAAGLLRLGLQDQVAEYLDPLLFVPAVGQGALGLEARAEDEEAQALARSIEDGATRQAVTAERSVLMALGGGCRVPVAAYGWVGDGRLHLVGMAVLPEEGRVVQARADGPPEEAEALGYHLAHLLREQGVPALAPGGAGEG